MGRRVPYYIDCLEEELASRQKRNPHYSLRGFANALRVDASHLSKIMGRKQTPSLKLAQTMFQLLDEKRFSRVQFIESVAEEARCRSLNVFDASMTDCPA